MYNNNAMEPFNKLFEQIKEVREKAVQMAPQFPSVDEMLRKEALQMAVEHAKPDENVFELADLYFSYIKHGILFKGE